MVEKIKLEVVNTGTAHSDLSINQILSSNFVCLIDTTWNPEETENKKAQHHEHTSHNLYLVMTAPFFLLKSVCSLH